MNRNYQHTQQKNNDSAYYVRAGHQAKQQGKYAAAIENYLNAIKIEPKNHQNKLYLCALLKNIEFVQFNPKIKVVILKLLNTPGVDYQNLWKPWYSILMCDPAMKEFQSLVNKQDFNEKKLKSCLSQSYFVNGLQKIICLDKDFELALKKIFTKISEGEIYPKNFRHALEIYCENTEYIFCEDKKENQYETDNTIKSISSVDNQISQSVKDQYEENPYPRWISCDLLGELTSAKEPYDHLIAGCGTGYGLCMTATRFPEAQITAFDLSLASLTYAKKKAKEFGFSNIDFYQADILNLESLDKKFDVIECSGVLHHMENPLIGWQSLIKKLKPDGRMNIGLYSELGRKDVVAARELIQEKGFKVTHQDIQSAREEIMSLPVNHEAYSVIKRRDFYSTSSCRDLLFHIQEHRFTIKDIAEAMNKLGLDFLGFSVEDMDIFRKYHQMFPEDQKANNLLNWATFEEQNPDSFRGMYQFSCKLAD